MLVGCSAASRKAQRLERAERNFKARHYDEARIDYMASTFLGSIRSTAM